MLRAGVVVLLLATASGAAAQEGAQPWQPVAPDGTPADFDWIRLASDEWLKGEIVSMYDGELEFDSDELGTLELDFADLKEIRTSRIVQVGFADDDSAVGTLVLDGVRARVTGAEGEVEFASGDILTLIVGAPKEINYWSFNLSVGGNIRSGNTDQIDYTARLAARRRSVRDLFGLEYLGNITEINSDETSNNHRATLGWDRFVSHRLFVNIVGAEWYRDPFQNIANRWTITAGLGYQLLDTPRTTWSVTAGPAWQATEWLSVRAGEDDAADSLAMRLGTRFDHELTGSIDLYAVYNAFFTDQESGAYTHHVDTGIDIELIGDFDFNLAWVWDRVRDPRPLEDGRTPEKDDTRLVFGLGWSF
jgi:hypothetical protein